MQIEASISAMTDSILAVRIAAPGGLTQCGGIIPKEQKMFSLGFSAIYFQFSNPPSPPPTSPSMEGTGTHFITLSLFFISCGKETLASKYTLEVQTYFHSNPVPHTWYTIWKAATGRKGNIGNYAKFMVNKKHLKPRSMHFGLLTEGWHSRPACGFHLYTGAILILFPQMPGCMDSQPQRLKSLPAALQDTFPPFCSGRQMFVSRSSLCKSKGREQWDMGLLV